jgi:hypothetical protein
LKGVLALCRRGYRSKERLVTEVMRKRFFFAIEITLSDGG